MMQIYCGIYGIICNTFCGNPIAVLYFAIVFSLTLKTVVGQQVSNFITPLYCHYFGSHDVIGHMTIRSALGSFL